MVLNDIIEQAAGRHSQTSDHGGKYLYKYIYGRPKSVANITHTIFLFSVLLVHFSVRRAYFVINYFREIV